MPPPRIYDFSAQTKTERGPEIHVHERDPFSLRWNCDADHVVISNGIGQRPARGEQWLDARTTTQFQLRAVRDGQEDVRFVRVVMLKPRMVLTASVKSGKKNDKLSLSWVNAPSGATLQLGNGLDFWDVSGDHVDDWTIVAEPGTTQVYTLKASNGETATCEVKVDVDVSQGSVGKLNFFRLLAGDQVGRAIEVPKGTRYTVDWSTEGTTQVLLQKGSEDPKPVDAAGALVDQVADADTAYTLWLEGGGFKNFFIGSVTAVAPFVDNGDPAGDADAAVDNFYCATKKDDSGRFIAAPGDSLGFRWSTRGWRGNTVVFQACGDDTMSDVSDVNYLYVRKFNPTDGVQKFTISVWEGKSLDVLRGQGNRLASSTIEVRIDQSGGLVRVKSFWAEGAPAGDDGAAHAKWNALLKLRWELEGDGTDGTLRIENGNGSKVDLASNLTEYQDEAVTRVTRHTQQQIFTLTVIDQAGAETSNSLTLPVFIDRVEPKINNFYCDVHQAELGNVGHFFWSTQRDDGHSLWISDGGDKWKDVTTVAGEPLAWTFKNEGSRTFYLIIVEGPKVDGDELRRAEFPVTVDGKCVIEKFYVTMKGETKEIDSAPAGAQLEANWKVRHASGGLELFRKDGSEIPKSMFGSARDDNEAGSLQFVLEGDCTLILQGFGAADRARYQSATQELHLSATDPSEIGPPHAEVEPGHDPVPTMPTVNEFGGAVENGEEVVTPGMEIELPTGFGGSLSKTFPIHEIGELTLGVSFETSGSIEVGEVAEGTTRKGALKDFSLELGKNFDVSLKGSGLDLEYAFSFELSAGTVKFSPVTLGLELPAFPGWKAELKLSAALWETEVMEGGRKRQLKNRAKTDYLFIEAEAELSLSTEKLCEKRYEKVRNFKANSETKLTFTAKLQPEWESLVPKVVNLSKLGGDLFAGVETGFIYGAVQLIQTFFRYMEFMSDMDRLDRTKNAWVDAFRRGFRYGFYYGKGYAEDPQEEIDEESKKVFKEASNGGKAAHEKSFEKWKEDLDDASRGDLEERFRQSLIDNDEKVKQAVHTLSLAYEAEAKKKIACEFVEKWKNDNPSICAGMVQRWFFTNSARDEKCPTPYVAEGTFSALPEEIQSAYASIPLPDDWRINGIGSGRYPIEGRDFDVRNP